MKKTSLSKDRQKRLVKVPEHNNIYALIPPATPTPSSISSKEASTEIRIAEAELDKLKIQSELLGNPELLTRTAYRREAVRSSQIEGTYSELDQLFTYEATGSDEGMPVDVHETKSYVDALEIGLERVKDSGAKTTTTALILDLHAKLMATSHCSDNAGQFRTNQNWIGGGSRIENARFVPPPADKIQECMDDLEKHLQYIPDDELQMYPSIVARMAIIHAQFETIHPFIDGNGRVGRILLPLMLAAEGHPPVYLAGYLKNNQEEYYDRLAGVQLKGEWKEWIIFFAKATTAAASEALETADALRKLLKEWNDKVVALGRRKDAVILKFPELLMRKPIVTMETAAKELGTSYPSASQALEKLHELGIVTKEKEQRRNRVFIATEVIDILNKPPNYHQ
ncbi:MAG: Fic family protein [Deltaproteobacteria bacterium]|nr:Fic family protein [Deltaproteobacteria bacterium]